MEGIESKGSHQLIRDINCDIAKGYYYGYPMLTEDFTKLLIDYKNEQQGFAKNAFLKSN